MNVFHSVFDAYIILSSGNFIRLLFHFDKIISTSYFFRLKNFPPYALMPFSRKLYLNERRQRWHFSHFVFFFSSSPSFTHSPSMLGWHRLVLAFIQWRKCNYNKVSYQQRHTHTHKKGTAYTRLFDKCWKCTYV